MERIENKRYEKFVKLFMWLAIGSLVVALFLLPEVIRGEGSILDYILMLAPIGLYFNYRRTAKYWGGQFIEWDDTLIKYKTREPNVTIIRISDIERVDIKLDIIKIKMKDSEERTLNIEDYSKYEDRIRIKKNFEKLKN